MKRYEDPERSEWAEIVQRPRRERSQIESRVTEIMYAVKSEGDRAVRRYTEAFDCAKLERFEVKEREFRAAENMVGSELRVAIEIAAGNIRRFHEAQRETVDMVETVPGVKCWRKSIPISPVGLYIPGGSAPLISTVLMLGIPALIAGCERIVVCTPPQQDGTVNPGILFALKFLGLDSVYRIGGAQAIAAMAYGTESIPKVEKIFGPGNQYVTLAKELAQRSGTAIDMPAGPSEVAVLADKSCVPEFVAADLLSQAEHGADSQVLLVTDSAEVLNNIESEIALQLEKLPRRQIAQKALIASRAVIVSSITRGMDLINAYAPEHLILCLEKAREVSESVRNAGSVFIGNYSPESAGDYASGTNHTLPTDGYASRMSGVSLDSFVKKVTYQELSAEGLKNIGETVQVLAAAEGLDAHREAVAIRLRRFDEK